ncbi:hypothetical protein ABZ348_29345 [Streptomyces sp. NPDC005963]|uniref:hypothetical protein n=1 Tax=Streptomyces sp. NPDC005963 TaxID=3156721 RepID=UPI00340C293C
MMTTAGADRRPPSLTWVESARVLSQTAAGRAGGVTPQLARDAAAVLRARESGRPAPSVRIAVLRRLPDPGVAALLTGHRPEGGGSPPTRGAGTQGRGVLPLVLAATEGRARLVIEPEAGGVLERLGRRLLEDRSLPTDTAGWLRQCRRTGRPWYEVEPGRAATLLWRRIQDVAGAVPDREAAELESFFAHPVSWLGGPADRRPLLVSTGAGTPVELLDVPCGTPGSAADATGAVRRLIGACHGVLLLFPARAVSSGAAPGELGPTVEWLGCWTEHLKACPHGPSVALVATVDERSGAGTVPELAGWLGGRLAALLDGLRPRLCAIATAEAHAVAGVLAAAAKSAPDAPSTRPGVALLTQALADRDSSGLTALGELVDSLARAGAEGLAELTRRRLAAAFDDTRLGCRDTAFAHNWPLDQLRANTPRSDSAGPAPTPGSTDRAAPPLAADEMWAQLENDAVGLLAARAAGQGRRTRSLGADPASGAAVTSPAPTSPTDPRPQGRKEDSS